MKFLTAAFTAIAVLSAVPAVARPLHSFLNLAMAPDGRHVASVEGDDDDSGGDMVRSLVIRDTTTGAAVTVALPCAGEPDCAPGAPAWSPDGSRLAFALRLPGGHARSVFSAAADGGDVTRIAAFNGTIISLRYAPGGKLAALAVADADAEIGATQAGADAVGEIGADPRPQRIAIIAGGTLHWASPADLYVYEYDWDPDGSGFVGTAASGDGNAHWWVAKLYAFGHGIARVLHEPADRREQMAYPRVSPDGTKVSFVGGLMSDFDLPGGEAFVVPRLGGPAVPAAPGLRGSVTSLMWGCAPGTLVAGVFDGPRMVLAELDPAAGTSRTVWRGERGLAATDGAVSLGCGAQQAATIRQSFSEPPELAAGPLGDMRDLTRANAGLTAPFDAVDVEWKSDALDVQGWLLLPAGRTPGAKLPMITVVHGGPASAVMPEFLGPGTDLALLAHGYALFLPNPRGSFGQSEAFTRANAGDLGGGDFRDILAGIDAAAALAPIDTARLGITGVSYGGFMTLWSVTQTGRFRAAVARAGISNWFSYFGQNGISDWLIPYFGATPYDDPAAYARVSPIGFVKNVSAPVLLLVGENDIECPPPQSMEFWHALRVRAVPTTMVVYPGEGHELRAPKNIADAAARTTAWFDRILKQAP